MAKNVCYNRLKPSLLGLEALATNCNDFLLFCSIVAALHERCLDKISQTTHIKSIYTFWYVSLDHAYSGCLIICGVMPASKRLAVGTFELRVFKAKHIRWHKIYICSIDSTNNITYALRHIYLFQKHQMHSQCFVYL